MRYIFGPRHISTYLEPVSWALSLSRTGFTFDFWPVQHGEIHNWSQRKFISETSSCSMNLKFFSIEPIWAISQFSWCNFSALEYPKIKTEDMLRKRKSYLSDKKRIIGKACVLTELRPYYKPPRKSAVQKMKCAIPIWNWARLHSGTHFSKLNFTIWASIEIMQLTSYGSD